MSKESTLTRKAKLLLKQHGFKVWKNHGSQYSENALSDLMALRNGKFWAIETKRKENKNRPEDQRRFLEDCKKHGAEVAMFLDSIEELEELLKGYPNEGNIR